MAKVSIPDLVIYELNFFKLSSSSLNGAIFMFVKTCVGGIGGFRRTVKDRSYVFSKMNNPFKEYFQRLKTGQFWGHVQSFFDQGSGVWGLMVLNFI